MQLPIIFIWFYYRIDISDDHYIVYVLYYTNLLFDLICNLSLIITFTQINENKNKNLEIKGYSKEASVLL